jgi:glutathionylspermidine synthase
VADAFDILTAHAIAPEEVDAIVTAGAAVANVYRRVAPLLRRASDEALRSLGVPGHVLAAARVAIPGLADCVLGRFDFVRTPRGYRMLELNADNPGLLVETFSVNAEVCRETRARDPNEGGERILARRLTAAVAAAARHVGKRSLDEARVVTASHGAYPRDRGIATYLARLLEGCRARYHPIQSLQIDADGLYDPAGDRIDVLYRVFPLQFLHDELFEPRGAQIDPAMGGLLLRLVADGRLALLNPPAAFLLESKALQAVIWNLFETRQYFSDDERAAIGRYMLPTYLDRPAGGTAYVTKPAYGGTGDTVSITGRRGTLIGRSRATTYAEHVMVYQQYVPVAAQPMMTEHGRRRLHPVASCFVVDGEAMGICLRAGAAITDESAWVVPLAVGGCTPGAAHVASGSPPPERRQ